MNIKFDKILNQLREADLSQSEADDLYLKLDQSPPQTLTGLTDGDVAVNGSKLVTTQYAHTYYVSKIGNDDNTGKSEGTAFLTINKPYHQIHNLLTLY